MGWGWGTHIQKNMVCNGWQGVTSSNLLQPFLVSFNPCLSFFTFFHAKPPSLDLVGEIVHGSTDLLSMSRWGGWGHPPSPNVKAKKRYTWECRVPLLADIIHQTAFAASLYVIFIALSKSTMSF